MNPYMNELINPRILGKVRTVTFLNTRSTSYFSSNKRRFGGPGGVVREIDSLTRPKSVRGNWPLWSPVFSGGAPVASRGLPLTTGRTKKLYISNTTMGPNL